MIYVGGYFLAGFLIGITRLYFYGPLTDGTDEMNSFWSLSLLTAAWPLFAPLVVVKLATPVIKSVDDRLQGLTPQVREKRKSLPERSAGQLSVPTQDGQLSKVSSR